MKTIHLSLQEFDNFRKLAVKYAIKFMCEITHSDIIVVADSEKLEDLGY